MVLPRIIYLANFFKSPVTEVEEVEDGFFTSEPKFVNV